jgi:antitoxin component YwqK of YwqJK toxin-antitoxin module
MKSTFCITLLFSLFACNNQKEPESFKAIQIIVPKVFVPKSSKNITFKEDTLLVDQKKYSGYIIDFLSNKKDTLLIEGYYDGLMNGISKKWYDNKMLKEERYFKDGKKNGKQVRFWENGQKKFEFNALNDACEGTITEWNYDGKLYHIGNYKNGQEEGTQKLWYETGKIRANFVIINGKRYGLLGTKNCKNVSDSIFVVK